MWPSERKIDIDVTNPHLLRLKAERYNLLLIKRIYNNSKLGGEEMIVCSCNVFSDKDVRGVLCDRAKGIRCAKQVYDCLGCSPQCGRCAITIQSLIVEQEGRIPALNGKPVEVEAELLAL